jgi:hypothetical protein
MKPEPPRWLLLLVLAAVAAGVGLGSWLFRSVAGG